MNNNNTVDEDSLTDTSDEDIESRFMSQHGDPLYDEHADSEDERWVKENLFHGGLFRRQRGGITDKRNLRDEEWKDLDDDEFQLSCPCCFTLLCVQCQQHEEYENQFRAIFVRNCRVRTDQRLKVRVRGAEGDQEYQQLKEAGKVSDLQNKYLPVVCAVCHTEVGVLDQDEVYHFCNVLY
ncbi:E2F-associated phosphoprotein [Galdieria sulphuraria]|nr:E2F-associated phosphoprotein [Galdieria sulphuraria]